MATEPTAGDATDGDWFADIVPPSAQRSSMSRSALVEAPNLSAAVLVAPHSVRGTQVAPQPTVDATPPQARATGFDDTQSEDGSGHNSTPLRSKRGSGLDAIVDFHKWAVLGQVMESRRSASTKVACAGAAALHHRAARDEAARKLITNHVAVLNDVTNPNPLTQGHLKRVPRSLARYVDQALRETARRLLGRRPHIPEAVLLDIFNEERLDPLNEDQVVAWRETSEYLHERIHAVPEDAPNRKPDMSLAAAAAMQAVLHEVGTGNSLSGGTVPGIILADVHSRVSTTVMCSIS